MLKSQKEIKDAWTHILERRRLGEPDDRRPIKNQDRLAKMMTTWQNEWITTELTPKQRSTKWSSQTSIVTAWVYHHYGGKNFIMAVWQTGITWAPTPELLNTNFNGVVEHVATNFASWTRRLARAVTRHKQDPKTEEARRRSGNSYGMHGLTEQQLQDRTAREKAR